MAIFINLQRGEYMDNGVSPRQRKLYVLRWNPDISSCTKEEFMDDFEWFKEGAHVNSEKWGPDKALYWTVYDWQSVEYMDLFVMVNVGKEGNGIMGMGFLHSYPMDCGPRSRSKLFKLSFSFMQDPAMTGLLTGDDICRNIPGIDWLHGHSGELIPVDKAEELAMHVINVLKNQEDGDHLKFNESDEKKYVLQDIMTFLCPKLKRRLLDMGKTSRPEITDIDNLMVEFTDEDYQRWKSIEHHIILRRLNGLLM